MSDQRPGPEKEFWAGVGWGLMVLAGMVLVVVTILNLLGYL